MDPNIQYSLDQPNHGIAGVPFQFESFSIRLWEPCRASFIISSFGVNKAGLESRSISRRPQQVLVGNMPMHPPTGPVPPGRS